MLTAAIVSTDIASSGHLQACLQQTGLVASVREWEPSPKRHPSPTESVPDIVLLDLADPCDIHSHFAFASHVRRLRPTVLVLACSSAPPSPELLLQAMRCGIQDFLPKPIAPAALGETLLRLLRESRVESLHPASGQLLVALGAKGGVGTTTVAVNLAIQLTRLTQKRVVLLDLACPMGDVALLLDLQGHFSVREAVESLDQLDAHLLGDFLVRHPSGLQVLPGTSYPDEWQKLRVPALARLVTLAQSAFDFVVLDLGSVYSSEWRSILGWASIVLVAEADVPGLAKLERHLFALSALGISSEQIRVVINRWHRRDEEVLKIAERKIGRSVFARLPNDFQQLSKAIDRGAPLSENNGHSLGAKFRELASRLAGLSTVPPETGGVLANLFSWSGTARRGHVGAPLKS